MLDAGQTGLFLEVEIYGETGTTPIATINLDHVANGLYRAVSAFVPATAEKFTLLFIVFTDSGRTIESSTESRSTEALETDVLPTLASGLPPRS